MKRNSPTGSSKQASCPANECENLRINSFRSEINMFKKTLSTILLIPAAMLAAPAMVYAQDTSVAQPKRAATAKVVKSGRIEVDGIQYHYQIRGQGEPLLLLHGGLGSVDMFAPIIPVLSAKRQIIGVDLQGHGRTPLAVGPSAWRRWARIWR